jgi:Lon protease-like protein
MSDDAPAIRVNFNRPMPIFPLREVVLFPHAAIPLHIFEDRYREMVADALDASGQIAMAVFEGERWTEEYHGRPPVRPAVCVGQILQHESLPDGRFNVILQGVCRARIEEEIADEDSDTLYRVARLEPVGVNASDEGLDTHRERVRDLLDTAQIKQFVDLRGEPIAETIMGYIDRPDVPTAAVLDLVGHLIVREPNVKYGLLAEPDIEQRAEMVEHELRHLRTMIAKASLQVDPEAPKGVSWN